MTSASVVLDSNEPVALTVRDLELNDDPSIWVENTTPPELRGEMLVSIRRSSGIGEDLLTISKSWIPQDLTEQLPKAQILASNDFRKAIQKGHLRVISHKHAQSILGTTAAQAEVQRIRNVLAATRAALSASAVSAEQARQGGMATVTHNGEAVTASPDAAKNQQFAGFLTKLEGKNGIEVLNELKSLGQHPLGREQLNVIYTKFQAMEEVRAWCLEEAEYIKGLASKVPEKLF